jgi:hypothetical protein
MSNQSGTIGRNRGLSIGGQMRRQRSQEWTDRHYKNQQHHQQQQPHSSSEEENECIGRSGGINGASGGGIGMGATNGGLHGATSIENNSSSILAQLIAQSQKFSSELLRIKGMYGVKYFTLCFLCGKGLGSG